MAPVPVPLRVVRMGQAGEGVGYLPDGRVAFVAGALPGELVRVGITEEHTHFVRAQALAVDLPSPERISPVCPVYARCGGCNFQHWAYAAELRHKEQQVRDALARIGGLDPATVRPIIGAADPYGYRNKGQFPWGSDGQGRPRLGLYARRSHQVVPVDACAIQDAVVNAVLPVARQLAESLGLSVYEEGVHRGILRHLLVRSSRLERRALVAIVVAEMDDRLAEFARRLMEAVPAVAGVAANVNPGHGNRVLGPTTHLLAGSAYLHEQILGLTFRLSALAFFQVNPQQVEPLYRAAIATLVGHSARVWDLYAGVGTLACLAAHRAKNVTAVEVHPEAVKDGRVNAALNHMSNVTFYQGTVETVLARTQEIAQERPNVVLVDPPRSGLSADVLHLLTRLKPARITYVSCNPATLARDGERLQETYRLAWVQPVDMFPRTDHVESCAAFEYRDRLPKPCNAK